MHENGACCLTVHIISVSKRYSMKTSLTYWTTENSIIRAGCQWESASLAWVQSLAIQGETVFIVPVTFSSLVLISAFCGFI